MCDLINPLALPICIIANLYHSFNIIEWLCFYLIEFLLPFNTLDSVFYLGRFDGQTDKFIIIAKVRRILVVFDCSVFILFYCSFFCFWETQGLSSGANDFQFDDVNLPIHQYSHNDAQLKY